MFVSHGSDGYGLFSVNDSPFSALLCSAQIHTKCTHNTDCVRVKLRINKYFVLNRTVFLWFLWFTYYLRRAFEVQVHCKKKNVFTGGQKSVLYL